MSKDDLTSIPLPVGMGSKGLTKKTAKEMLQEALKDHKQSSRKEFSTSNKSASNKLAAVLGPKIKMTNNTTGANQSSQSIVDKLFKDFISQKLGSSGDDSAVSTELLSSHGGNFDELSKILDMEISSIKSQQEVRGCQEKHKKLPVSEDEMYQMSLSQSKRSKVKSSASSLKGKRPNIDDKNSLSNYEIKENNIGNKSDTPHFSSLQLPHLVRSDQEQDHDSSSLADIKSTSAFDSNILFLPKANASALEDQLATVSDNNTKSHFIKESKISSEENIRLPGVCLKKCASKMLGIKLSAESLSIIKSTDRIDRDGKVWEEGEVHSEESDKDKTESDSESDGNPSETGSINSTEGEWKSLVSKKKRKHKHKHKHKKKKKKSSKNESIEGVKEKSRNRGSKDKIQEKLRSKAKESSHVGVEKTYGREKDTDKNRYKSTSNEEREEHKLKPEKRMDSRKDRFVDKQAEGSITCISRLWHSDKWTEKEQEQSRKAEKRKRSHSRSFSPRKHRKSKSRSQSPSGSPRRHKNWPSDERDHHNEWDTRRYSDKHSKCYKKDDSYLRKGKSSEKWKGPKDRSRSKEHDHEKDEQEKDLRLQIDKAKLRRIAIANALQNMKSGQGPRVDITALKSGGKSVEELTEFCKRISEKSKVKRESEFTDSSDEDVLHQGVDEDLPVHHPFKIKDSSSSSIVMNIKNAKQLPILTPSEKQAQQAALRLAFPVSSGSHHRASESEWVPVEKTASQCATVTLSTPAVSQVVIKEPTGEKSKQLESIFPDPAEAQKIDIGSIISERLQAVRRLQENPYDVQALSKMHQVQEQASKWATSKHLPGQFIGSTGAHVLSQEELLGDKRHQAWAKKVSSATKFTERCPLACYISAHYLVISLSTWNINVFFNSTLSCCTCEWWHWNVFASEDGMEAR